jgi:hypothetical protein
MPAVHFRIKSRPSTQNRHCSVDSSLSDAMRDSSALYSELSQTQRDMTVKHCVIGGIHDLLSPSFLRKSPQSAPNPQIWLGRPDVLLSDRRSPISQKKILIISVHLFIYPHTASAIPVETPSSRPTWSRAG